MATLELAGLSSAPPFAAVKIASSWDRFVLKVRYPMGLGERLNLLPGGKFCNSALPDGTSIAFACPAPASSHAWRVFKLPILA